jgi:hypothetical protein
MLRQPGERFRIRTELHLGVAGEHHPPGGKDVARRKAKRFLDVGLGFFGAAHEILGHTNATVSIG